MDIINKVDKVKEKLTDMEYKDIVDSIKTYYDKTEQLNRLYVLLRREYIKQSITFHNFVREYRGESDGEGFNDVDLEWEFFLQNYYSAERSNNEN
jgi:hypothetical protein